MIFPKGISLALFNFDSYINNLKKAGFSLIKKKEDFIDEDEDTGEVVTK